MAMRHPSPRIVRWGAFALGMLLTLGIFFSFQDRWQWLSASIADAVVSDDGIYFTSDLRFESSDTSLVITTARRFPAHVAQSFRVDILYNPLLFTSPSQFSLSSPYLLSSTMDNGILSILLAPADDEVLPSDTTLLTIHFNTVIDIRDIPIVESVRWYDPDQTQLLRVSQQ